MKLNHINLTVNDAQGARRLLEKYFGLKSIEGTTDDATFIALKDDDGMVITLMQQAAREITYPLTFHIGFLIHNEAKVREIYTALKNDGYEVTEPRKYRGNSVDLYFKTPYGFTIQVT
ncbi:VOC family protein [Oscillatoria amoena NRMC-F 0135]|nr:VOC family protein [Oscillatoria amoena NRMC-F 0135]